MLNDELLVKRLVWLSRVMLIVRLQLGLGMRVEIYVGGFIEPEILDGSKRISGCGDSLHEATYAVIRALASVYGVDVPEGLDPTGGIW